MNECKRYIESAYLIETNLFYHSQPRYSFVHSFTLCFTSPAATLSPTSNINITIAGCHLSHAHNFPFIERYFTHKENISYQLLFSFNYFFCPLTIMQYSWHESVWGNFLWEARWNILHMWREEEPHLELRVWPGEFRQSGLVTRYSVSGIHGTYPTLVSN